MEGSLYQKKLYVKSCFKVISIQNCFFLQKSNEHARAELKCLATRESLDMCEGQFRWKEICIHAIDMEDPIFAGLIETIDIEYDGDYASLSIRAVSGTILLDQAEQYRSFSKKQGYRQLMDFVLRGKGKAIYTSDNVDLKAPVMQYGETDWEFLKRAASSLGTCITPDINSLPEPRLYVGIRNGKVGRPFDTDHYKERWGTSESGLMEIGGIKAINMNSVLMCNPIKIQAYLSNGLNGGKIQAVDSGQGNLDNLLMEYKTEYDKAILSAINARTSLFTTFTMQMINEFIYLYEIRYPERERAFYIFIKEVDDQFSEYIMKIKCMTYMLEDRVARKMTEIMGGSVDIHLEMFMNANPSGGPNAYFIRESSEKSKIMYYDVINRENSFPPYKSFFHEFGHAIDNLAEDGTDYYSVKFVSTQTVDEKQLKYNYQAKAYYVETQKNTYTKTIHQWTELDLRNYLTQLVYDCMKGQKGTLSTQCPQFFQLDTKKQYDIAMYVINELFLFWDGAKKASTLSNISETKALYSEAFTAAKSEVGSYDIFGGLTGEQIGSGHGINYWFDNTGQRITDISKEAFAGFFEYMVLHPVPSARASYFDPNGSMPCAIQAMKEMFNLVV